MSTLSSRDPLGILRDMERRSRANTTDLPQKAVAAANWSGIGFRIHNTYMVAAGPDILEILGYPTVTRVAGTKNWVKGIANIRGNLLPIFDFGSFLSEERTVIGRNTRILVINKKGVYAGLLVDEILGQRQFDDSRKKPIKSDTALGSAYSTEGFELDDHIWHIMEIDRLVADPRFMQVAIS